MWPAGYAREQLPNDFGWPILDADHLRFFRGLGWCAGTPDLSAFTHHRQSRNFQPHLPHPQMIGRIGRYLGERISQRTSYVVFKGPGQDLNLPAIN